MWQWSYLLFLLVSLTPEVAHGIEQALLGRRLLWVPELTSLSLVGQVLLADKVAGVVMCILILLTIVKLLHELGGRIA